MSAAAPNREFGTTNFEILPGRKIHLFDHMGSPGEVNRILNTSRIVVDSIRPVGEDLESYFLKVAGGAVND